MDYVKKIELITVVMLILIITVIIALAIKYKILINDSDDQKYITPSLPKPPQPKPPQPKPPQPNPPQPNPPQPNPPQPKPPQPKPPQPNPPQPNPPQPNPPQPPQPNPPQPFPLFTPTNTPSNNITSTLCSPTPDTTWYGPLDDLSTNPKCTCRSNEMRLSKTMNGTIYYKCQLNNQ